MSDRYWLGTTSTDAALAINWGDVSGGGAGASVPVSGDNAIFDSGGNNPCTLTAAVALATLTTVAGYTAKIDLATFDLAMDAAGSITLDGAGEFACGSGTISITGGTLDLEDVGTWTPGTATIAFSGTCPWNHQHQARMDSVTVASGAAVTLTVNGGSNAWIDTELNVSGTLSIASGDWLLPTQACDVHLNDGAIVNGAGYLYFEWPQDGHGLVTFDAGAVLSAIVIVQTPQGTGEVLAPGTFGGRVKFTASTSRTLTLAAGSYDFAGGYEIQNDGGGLLTMANDTNAPSIAATDVVIDINSSGGVTIDDSGAAVDWDISGDVIDEITGAGGWTWTQGTGDVSLSGSADQDIDFSSLPSVPALQSIKTAGEVTLDAADLTLGGDFEAGSLVYNASAIDLDGFDLTLSAGSLTVPDTVPITGLANNWIEVSGDLSLTGLVGTPLDLDTVALTVGGSAAVRYATLTDCDASGGAVVVATDSTDAGGNLFISFGSWPLAAEAGAVAAALIVEGTVYAGAEQTFLARVEDVAGAAIVQADVASAEYTIRAYNPLNPNATPVEVTGHTAEALTVSAVVFDTLQTDAPWSEDGTGYNFRFTPDQAIDVAFATPGRLYRVEVELTPTASGRPPFELCWDMLAL